MLSNSLLPWATIILTLLGSVQSAPPKRNLDKRGVAFDYNSQKVRGVNLGGWFVLESWITPSLFNHGQSVIDEYTYTKVLGKAAAQKSLEAHWNGFIKEDDFKQIAKAGLNHVRIPIGYWAISPLKGEPYVQGQLPILDKAVGWARSAGLKVLLDLHGAPGSQNGFDNSGRNGTIGWLKGSTEPETVTAIRTLAKRYASDTDTVTSIELVNEPFSFDLSLDGIKSYCKDGYAAVHAASSNYATVLHDAFLPIDEWNGFMNAGGMNVLLDTHQYQIFNSTFLAWDIDMHIKAACAFEAPLKATDKWTIVGEWTGAMTDCTKWLNGRGLGARYDGSYQGTTGATKVGSCDGNKYSGTVAGMSADEKTQTRRFIEAQMDAYEARSGWMFWTWRTESSPEWDMRALIEGGVFPQPLTERKFPGQCRGA